MRRSSWAKNTGRVAAAIIAAAALAACLLPSLHVDASPTSDAGTADGPHCGAITFTAPACQACATTKCCAALAACGASAPCAAYEACLAACSGAACRAKCGIDHPTGTDDAVPTLDECLVASCAQPCDVACGSWTYQSTPDVAPACADCVTANACAAAEACGRDLDCARVRRCTLACRTLDCRGACKDAHPAGAILNETFTQDSYGNCHAACAIGGFWSCVGSVSWPLAKADTVRARISAFDALTTRPIANVTFTACRQFDIACKSPVDSATTDVAGNATVTVPTLGVQQQGFNGYFQASGPGVYPALYFTPAPLTEAEFPLSLAVVTAAAWSDFSALTGVKFDDARRGHALVFMNDCFGISAPDVSYSADSADSSTTPVYFAGLLPSVTAKKTDALGLGGFFNLPAGPVVITATPTTVALKPAATVSMFVRAGTLSTTPLVPSP